MRMNGLLAIAAALAMAACSKASGEDPNGVDPSLSPNVVAVETGDYFFNAPDTIPSGMTTFRMTMGGTEFHHIVAVQLEPGRTVAELQRFLESSHLFPAWAREVGGPNAVVPGGHSDATVDLQPGNYAIVCVIPAKDGQIHAVKGMIRPLTVIPRDGPNAPAPEAQVVMTLSDYDFTVTPAITAGRHTIKLENVAEQPHEAILIKLAPGKTLDDMMAWFANEQGPPPGMPMGGITFIAKGELNYVTLDFEEGEYAIICFVPDATDGRPHFMHGMAKQFRVG